ncbi:hypothetical protein JAAARDRAFT_198884 [Jaapia argillacea MUCL 33604]|uniref:HAT C-terminal dimerisation domain-containing protein n=1 Tax=Jaapia argillacea MUCL 33604 TaxID=933084 RepID=A0A067PLC0_9AGAM|nr:hypothetical protein JAAARDRAFT_198884 [Jaapia argillacea MUCL 33604]
MVLSGDNDSIPPLAYDSDDEEDGTDDDIDQDDEDEGEVDELEVLDTGAQEKLLQATQEVRTTLTKVHQLAFAIIHSTNMALPAWQQACQTHRLPICLIPHDVVTCWDLTYTIMVLKLRKFELDADDWKIVEDLVHILVAQYKDHTDETVDGDGPDSRMEVSDDEYGGFTNVSLAGKVSSRDELDEYLSLPAETVKDPLKWWWDNQKAYPNLHQMALDYLSVPVSPSSIQASLCLGSWGQCNLLHISDLLATVTKKRKRVSEIVEEVEEVVEIL